MDDTRKNVREVYGKIGREGRGESCGCSPACCGDGDQAGAAAGAARIMGYSEAELDAAPPGANLGLGCGNPQAIAALKPGETVVDLGSGGGFDCFLAARAVGESGRVIGVDMTPEMVSRARENAARGGPANVEFRLGEIEHLPLADRSADVIISNCVVNLSPDKPAVFREAFRVLKPGGRLAVSDIVALKEMPAAMRDNPALQAACVSGAATVPELERALREAGFVRARIGLKAESREFIRDWTGGTGIEEYISSASIEAVKPAGEDRA